MSKKIGLVLSGGGVRGAAHIGVMQVLEEEGIDITHVAGASAGSIVGALYAAGHPPQDILEFYKKAAIFKISNYALFKPGIIDTDKLISVFNKYIEEDTYESLKRTLFIIATDLEQGRSKIFDSGPLIKTILASSAFPMVFAPVTIDDVLYADGGIINNFPVEPLEELCDHLIGVYVNPVNPIKKESLDSALSVLERSYQLSINASSVKKFDKLDVMICPEALSEFDTFNTEPIDEIYEIGYEAAKKCIPDFKKLVND